MKSEDSGSTEIPCALLSRVTLSYDMSEDRIRIAGETAQGDTCSLWLTHRLLVRLIPHLLWLVEVRSDSLATSPLATPADSAAVEAPVQPGSEGAEFLVAAVDVNEQQGHVLLTFRSSAQAARLVMNPDQLRMWLAGVRRCALKGEWQLPAAAKQATGMLAEVPASVTIH